MLATNATMGKVSQIWRDRLLGAVITTAELCVVTVNAVPICWILRREATALPCHRAATHTTPSSIHLHLRSHLRSLSLLSGHPTDSPCVILLSAFQSALRYRVLCDHTTDFP
jgi:hypothetical protein